MQIFTTGIRVVRLLLEPLALARALVVTAIVGTALASLAIVSPQFSASPMVVADGCGVMRCDPAPMISRHMRQAMIAARWGSGSSVGAINRDEVALGPGSVGVHSPENVVVETRYGMFRPGLGERAPGPPPPRRPSPPVPNPMYAFTDPNHPLNGGTEMPK